jgi:hypothetical protein
VLPEPVAAPLLREFLAMQITPIYSTASGHTPAALSKENSRIFRHFAVWRIPIFGNPSQSKYGATEWIRFFLIIFP